MEIWKDIKGYESLCQVSNYGNVRSLLFGKIHLLKASKNSSGYLTVALCRQGEAVKYRNEVMKCNDAFYAVETETATA